MKSKEMYTFSRELTKEDTDITETYRLPLTEGYLRNVTICLRDCFHHLACIARFYLLFDVFMLCRKFQLIPTSIF